MRLDPLSLDAHRVPNKALPHACGAIMDHELLGLIQLIATVCYGAGLLLALTVLGLTVKTAV